MRFLRTHGWLFAVIAIASFVMLWRLDAQPIVNFDEGIHGEVSWEMVETGSWLTPQYTGGPYFRKPPLKIWATAALFRWFGISPWTLRLPSALAGIGVVLLIAWWMWEWTRSRWAAMLAGVIVATSPAIFEHAFRTGEMDGVLTLFVTLALYCWWKTMTITECVPPMNDQIPSTKHQTIFKYKTPKPFRLIIGYWKLFGAWCLVLGHSKQTFWLLLSGAATGLAVMTKSAAGLLPLPIIALDYLLHRRWRTIRFRALWFSVLTFSVLVVPWHFAMTLLHGAAFWNEYLGFHVVRRITEQLHNAGAGPLWYFGAMRRIFTPWVWWLIAAVFFEFILSEARAKRRISHGGTNTPKSTAPRMGEILRHFVPQDKLIPQDKLLQLLLLWIAITFVGFSAVQTKFAWYLLPMLPACAILIAWFVHALESTTSPNRGDTVLHGRAKLCHALRILVVIALVTTIGIAGTITYARLTREHPPSPFPAIADTLYATHADGLVAYGFAWQEQPAGYFMLRTSLPLVKLSDGLTDAARADAKLSERDRAWLITKATELPEELRTTVGVPHHIDGWSLWPRVVPQK